MENATLSQNIETLDQTDPAIPRQEASVSTGFTLRGVEALACEPKEVCQPFRPFWSEDGHPSASQLAGHDLGPKTAFDMDWRRVACSWVGMHAGLTVFICENRPLYLQSNGRRHENR